MAYPLRVLQRVGPLFVFELSMSLAEARGSRNRKLISKSRISTALFRDVARW